MVTSVPGDVDEADEGVLARSRRRPPETVRSDLVPPSALWVAAVRHNKVKHLLVRERIAPRKDDIVFGAAAHIRTLSRPLG